MKFLFAGHNSNDPGAVYNGIKEADLTKELRNLIVENLKSKRELVLIDIDSETNLQLQSRIKPGQGSVLTDIHFNASVNTKANGTEVIVSNNASKTSIAFATEMVTGICKILGTKNRGVITESKTARGKIGIVNTKAGISCLVEVCFLSSTSDMALYQSKKNEVAKFYADLLIKYDNLL